VSDVATLACQGFFSAAVKIHWASITSGWQLRIERYTNFTRFRKSREWQQLAHLYEGAN
jgi:hypothetical protein